MELRQLKYFASVAETKSFSEASRVLNVTQSTLSQQRQIAYTLIRLDICDVTDPYLVWPHWNYLFDKIVILMILMVRIRSLIMTTTFYLHH